MSTWDRGATVGERYIDYVVGAVETAESSEEQLEQLPAGSTVAFLLYRFVGEVSETGMITTPVSDSDSLWQITEYGLEEGGTSFEITYDTSLISKSKIEGLQNSTDDIGMTPMVARYIVSQGSNEIFYGFDSKTNESLYAFDSNGQIYPMVDDSTETDSGKYIYELSDGEVESLRTQYDLVDETNFEGIEFSELYTSQFDSYLDDLGNDLLNYIGTLMEPVINFNKTKNHKITDRQISSLHSMDTTATRVNLSVSAVDVSYNEEV